MACVAEPTIRRLLATVLALLTLAAQPVAAEPRPSPARVVVPLDAGWRFARDDVAGAALAAFDDKDWRDVTLPHTYNGADGDDGGGYYRGPAWYRRSFTLAPQAGRRLFVQFDGAALATDVYVNGTRVGRHEGGHAGFRFDITDAVRPGANFLAVRVDNSAGSTISPLGGDFTVFGGLYRRVFLIETAGVHLDMLDHGGPGVYVSATVTPAGAAAVAITARVSGAGVPGRRVRLRSTILDASGAVVASAAAPAKVEPGRTRTVRLRAQIASPRRWNGRADPYLYRVVTEVTASDGALLDSVEVPLGVRTIAFDAKRGFLLNGRPYPLRGVNLFHSGRPGRGLAVTDDEIKADFATLDELGSTGVRMVHFQHPPAAYDAADRLGLATWTEIGLNGRIDPGPAFQANVERQMRELIRQNYNHPSVVLWGLGNEVYSVDPAVTRVLRAAQAVAKAEDPSRPTVYAHCCQADDIDKARVSDVIAFNRYFGWYGEQNGMIGEWADGFHRKYPDKPFLVGEYGAGASIRHQADPSMTGKIDPPGAWHPEGTQTAHHELNGPQLEARDYLAGAFIWVGFDLASDGRDEGDRAGVNDKGLVTYDRAVRKDAFYFYQARWSERPVLHLVDKRLNWRTTAMVDVRAYSNVGPVSLTVNGRLVGVAQAVDHVARWRGVTLRPGLNRIEISAVQGGQTMRDTAEWRLEPAGQIAPFVPRPPEESRPAAAPVKPPGQ
jgi:beta-galactosidase